MRVAFVTNFCPHYRVRTFELLARQIGAEFLFFSRGGERYWPTRFGVRRGEFPHTYLSGWSVAGTRVSPGLAPRLLSGRWDAVIKCINGRFALPVSYLAARLRGVPFVLWTGVWQRLDTPAHRAFYPVVRWIYRHADAVVVYGSHVERFLLSEGVPAERIFVTPHAVDNDTYRRPVPATESADLRRHFGIPAEALLVLFVGRLVPEKGVDLLLRAFASLRHSRAHLLFVGEGKELSALRASSSRLGVAPRVHFATSVAPDEIVPFYAASDLLVLPSVTTPTFREPWGLVVNEAFNQGIPALVSDAVGAGAGGLVTDGETGRVVPEGDVGALSRALDELLAAPQLRQRLGEAARRRVLEWNHQAMVDAFEAAVDFACGETGRPV